MGKAFTGSRLARNLCVVVGVDSIVISVLFSHLYKYILALWRSKRVNKNNEVKIRASATSQPTTIDMNTSR